jgi:hypothetical protein
MELAKYPSQWYSIVVCSTGGLTKIMKTFLDLLGFIAAQRDTLFFRVWLTQHTSMIEKHTF